MLKDGLHRMRQKILRGLLLVATLGAWSWAEGGQASPAAGLSPQAKTNPAVQAARPASKSPATPAVTRVAKPKPAAKVTVKRALGKTGKETGSVSAPKQPVVASSRDPFKLPPPPGPPGQAGPAITGPLPPGTRGLVIDQLRVEGIVRLDTTNTMIAVVTNYTKRAYFLRLNDQLYNGVVSKITPDSVYFRENYLDSNGRVVTREVVRRLG